MLSYDEQSRGAAVLHRHQNATIGAVIAGLDWMGDIADADVALRRGDDLARLDAAAALNQLTIKAGFVEKSDSIGHELCLVDRHRYRVDHAAGLVFSPRPARRDRGATAGDDRQRRTSRELFCHHAGSLSFLTTCSRAFSTA